MKKLILLFTVLASSLAFGQGSVTYTNAGTTGTTLNSLAIINTSDNAVIASTSNTGVPTYVVVGGAGTSGLAVLSVVGQANCTMDSTIASAAGGFYVIASTTTGGDCHAQSAAPAFGTWVVGYLASASTTSGSVAAVTLGGYYFTGATLGGAGSGLTTGPTSGVTTLDVAEFTGTAGQIADSSVLVANLTTAASNYTSGDLVKAAASNKTTSDSGIAAANVVTASSPGVGLCHFAGSTQACTSSAVVAADITNNTITGTQLASSLALVTPNVGAATGTSLLVSGNIDGTAPITVTTGTTANLGATFKSGYTFNQEATAGTGVTYTLPATAVGLQYCVRNSIVSGTGAADTGVLTVFPPASSFVILNGVRNTVGGGGTHGVASGGAAGDSACFVAIDATDWEVYVIRGTWTAN